MGTTRLWDKEEDYKKLGLKPGEVQLFESGRIIPAGRPGSEVWYFDAILDCGTKITLGCRTKTAFATDLPDAPPFAGLTLTDPDGNVITDFTSSEDYSFSSEKCDIKIGKHRITGDHKIYNLHLEAATKENAPSTVDGLEVNAAGGTGAELTFEALVEPFRQDTGRIILDENPDLFMAWIPIPSMKVSGELTIGGVTRKVTGTGYHDHRVMGVNDLYGWHHWVWGRQTLKDYSLVIYNIVSAEPYGFTQVPLFALYDNKTGKIIFQNNGSMEREIQEFSFDESTQKNWPKVIKYTLKDGSKTVEYTLKWKDILETRDFYAALPPEAQKALDERKMKPAYMRFFSQGNLKITDNDKVICDVSGDMIYEIAYNGLPDERAKFC